MRSVSYKLPDGSGCRFIVDLVDSGDPDLGCCERRNYAWHYKGTPTQARALAEAIPEERRWMTEISWRLNMLADRAEMSVEGAAAEVEDRLKDDRISWGPGCTAPRMEASKTIAGLTLLRRAAKKGLLVESKSWKTIYFTTTEWEAAAESERNLTDEERAERFAAHIMKRHEADAEDNRRRGREDSWSMTTHSNERDGRQQAIDLGLVEKARQLSDSSHFIHASRAQSYHDALAREKASAAKAKAEFESDTEAVLDWLGEPVTIGNPSAALMRAIAERITV